ncbi:hypothetical protein KIPB_001099 [Kipferlia bialata]|uniref:Uncharacterized protein n=1 Tax=Kipferlia bialata TaxID=797122 RepID=A0A9K3GFI7_9EUKA|nr:hypothetical protein KIPB_001099 [Kipferlia bialata]|eukprot:g1099.t1
MGGFDDFTLMLCDLTGAAMGDILLFLPLLAMPLVGFFLPFIKNPSTLLCVLEAVSAETGAPWVDSLLTQLKNSQTKVSVGVPVLHISQICKKMEAVGASVSEISDPKPVAAQDLVRNVLWYCGQFEADTALGMICASSNLFVSVHLCDLLSHIDGETIRLKSALVRRQQSLVTLAQTLAASMRTGYHMALAYLEWAPLAGQGGASDPASLSVTTLQGVVRAILTEAAQHITNGTSQTEISAFFCLCDNHGCRKVANDTCVALSAAGREGGPGRQSAAVYWLAASGAKDEARALVSDVLSDRGVGVERVLLRQRLVRDLEGNLDVPEVCLASGLLRLEGLIASGLYQEAADRLVDLACDRSMPLVYLVHLLSVGLPLLDLRPLPLSPHQMHALMVRWADAADIVSCGLGLAGEDTESSAYESLVTVLDGAILSAYSHAQTRGVRQGDNDMCLSDLAG